MSASFPPLSRTSAVAFVLQVKFRDCPYSLSRPAIWPGFKTKQTCAAAWPDWLSAFPFSAIFRVTRHLSVSLTKYPPANFEPN
jgi:hypothetical protein